MSFRPKAKSSIGGLTAKKGSKKVEKPPVLWFTLDHGDIVVMHGREIQKFYEVSDHIRSKTLKECIVLILEQHAVTPKGSLRYALTCRYVRPEMMADDNEAQDAILKGTLPPGSEQYNYSGDINAVPVVRTSSDVDKFVNNVAARMETGDLTSADVREINARLVSIITPSSIVGPKRAIETSVNVSMLDVI
jgi:hypothetical protein